MQVVVSELEAQAQFPRLLEQAHAGQEIIVAKDGKPYARLMPLAAEPAVRMPGRVVGKLSAAFFEPLSAEELKAWDAGS